MFIDNTHGTLKGGHGCFAWRSAILTYFKLCSKVVLVAGSLLFPGRILEMSAVPRSSAMFWAGAARLGEFGGEKPEHGWSLTNGHNILNPVMAGPESPWRSVKKLKRVAVLWGDSGTSGNPGDGAMMCHGPWGAHFQGGTTKSEKGIGGYQVIKYYAVMWVRQ